MSGALDDAEVRDDLHLNPVTISRAAQARAMRAVRALEAFIRRLLILLALQFEHEIDVDVTHRPYPKKKRTRKARPLPEGGPSLRIFTSDLARPEYIPSAADPFSNAADPFASKALPAAPILARLKRLRHVIETAEARAHRLAFTLARHRHGILLAPLPLTLPNRMGTELTGIYGGMGHAILESSKHRPPPQKPRPPPPPRARFI